MNNFPRMHSQNLRILQNNLQTMNEPKRVRLYMMLLGLTPPGRNTEQHDVFFGIAESPAALVTPIKAFWPEAQGKIHVDGWRAVQCVDGYDVVVVDRKAFGKLASDNIKLYFINLGGYKPGEFEEFHYKLLVAAPDKGKAISIAKKSAFYAHTGFSTAPSHVDDKFGIDVDDSNEIEDILPIETTRQYAIRLVPSTEVTADEIHLGYFQLHKL